MGHCICVSCSGEQPRDGGRACVDPWMAGERSLPDRWTATCIYVVDMNFFDGCRRVEYVQDPTNTSLLCFRIGELLADQNDIRCIVVRGIYTLG